MSELEKQIQSRTAGGFDLGRKMSELGEKSQSGPAGNLSWAERWGDKIWDCLNAIEAETLKRVN
jgi:hypothetical protein